MERIFKFGSQNKASLGSAKFRIPYRGNQMKEIYLDVVDINIPLFLGLDRLNEQKMYVNNIEDVLLCVEPKRSHSITRKLWHLFYEWTNDVFYTDNELNLYDNGWRAIAECKRSLPIAGAIRMDIIHL